MLGAIIGDVIGSRFEFNNIKTKNFEIKSKKNVFTDDTVMTCAVADCCYRGITGNKSEVVKTLKKWGRKYPNAGYGGHFFYWLFNDYEEPYYSCGNGSAMRVSACGWFGNTEKEVKKLAKQVTEVTHNHPEGLKGAEVVAMCIYYARKGEYKAFIKKYVEKYYSLDFDYEELRRTYIHAEEICQNTVPQAIYCFLISNSFEDCLRTTISIGGDCDTTAAISCAIAEAYYGIPEDIGKYVLNEILSPEMQDLIKKIYNI